MGFHAPKWFTRTWLFFGLLILFGLLAWTQDRFLSTPFTVVQKKSPAQQVFPKGKAKRIARTHTLPVSSPLVINEIGLAQPDGPVKADGAPADWIEIYNRSPEVVPLMGYSLTDSSRKPRKFTFPDIMLQAGKSLLIWADGEYGISSPLTFKYVPSRERNGWERRPDLTVPAGYAWFCKVDQAEKEDNSQALGFTVVVPEDDEYSIWIRHKPVLNKSWIMEAMVDETETVATYQKPCKHYMMSRLRNPDDHEGFWPLTPGHHRVRLILRDGATSVDQIVLTRRNATFGAGFQDIHAPFKLRRSGELVALHSPRGLPLDYVTFPYLGAGQTYQRKTAGKGNFTIGDPTPCEQQWLAKPVISPHSGFVDAGTEITITAQPGATIHYTLDGRVPTRGSPVYGEPITISNSTAIRTRAFLTGAYPGPMAHQVFWVGDKPKVPVFWAIMQPVDLQSSHRGLLSNTSARGLTSERPCYACILYPDGTVQETDAGIRLQGRSTRRMKVKKSFRIFCRPRYGAAEWPGTLFGATPPTNHSSFVLIGHSVINHPIGLEVMDAVGTITPHVRHVLFQINNQPMGIYILVEDPNDSTYLEQIFGHLDLDMIKHKTLDAVKMGDEKAYYASWTALSEGPTSNITMEALGQIMDPDVFIRWIAGMQYLGVADNSQGYFVRDKQKDAPAWTLINWDMDGSLAVNAFHKRKMQAIFGLRGRLHKELLKDPAYRTRYLEGFQRLLNHPLRAEKWTGRINDYASTLLPETGFDYMGHEFQGSKLIRNKTPDELYYAYEDVYKNSHMFFTQQEEGVRRVLKREFLLDNYVLVNVQGKEDVSLMIDGYPEILPYDGIYFPGTTIEISSYSPADSDLFFTVNDITIQTNLLKLTITNTLDISVH